MPPKAAKKSNMTLPKSARCSSQGLVPVAYKTTLPPFPSSLMKALTCKQRRFGVTWERETMINDVDDDVDDAEEDAKQMEALEKERRANKALAQIFLECGYLRHKTGDLRLQLKKAKSAARAEKNKSKKELLASKVAALEVELQNAENKLADKTKGLDGAREDENISNAAALRASKDAKRKGVDAKRKGVGALTTCGDLACFEQDISAGAGDEHADNLVTFEFNAFQVTNLAEDMSLLLAQNNYTIPGIEAGGFYDSDPGPVQHVVVQKLAVRCQRRSVCPRSRKSQTAEKRNMIIAKMAKAVQAKSAPYR